MLIAKSYPYNTKRKVDENVDELMLRFELDDINRELRQAEGYERAALIARKKAILRELRSIQDLY